MRRPSVRQIKLCQILHMNPTISMRKALQQAGYSVSSQMNPKVIVSSQTFTYMADRFEMALIHQGFTPLYVAKKKMEWLEAQGENGPDYETQVKTFEIILKEEQLNKQRKQNFHSQKKPMSLDEYVNAT